MDKNGAPPRKLTQHVASLSVSLGAFAAGLAYVWSSPAGADGVNLRYPFAITPDEFSWVSSIFNIGAAAVSIPIGALVDSMGRRGAMLALTVPFTVGWACVVWPNSLTTLMIGRFAIGASSGALFFTVPMYTAEIADKEERGRLGSYFELFLCLGNLVVYALGSLNDMFLVSVISATAPLVFFAVFFFMPETPTYHLTRGNVRAARETLTWLRGGSSGYDVESELWEKKSVVDREKLDGASFIDSIGSRAARRGLFIGCGLMIFQGLSGFDTILFYADDIFTRATGTDGNSSTIVVGALKTMAVLSMSLVVDKWGRRSLLLISGFAMCLSSLAVGVFLYFLAEGSPMDGWTWVPMVGINGYLIFFSLGWAPIPWLIVGELFSPQIKGFAMSSTCSIAWLVAFLTTKFYRPGIDCIGLHGTFWVYSGFLALGLVFVYFAVPETKGKTLEELQVELSG